MVLYPLFADLRNRAVLVIGGGAVAARKVGALLESGATVRVVAEELSDDLARLRDDGRIQHVNAAFADHQLDGVWLVIAATSDPGLNRRVAAAAEARQLLANVVDDAALSGFHCPARLRRGALTIAISSGGRAPALARRLRAELETTLDPSWSSLAALASQYRNRIGARFGSTRQRRRFYDWMVDGPVRALLRRGHANEAEAALTQALQGVPVAADGRVTLVGAGPGDAGSLTLDALRALQCADVILYDRLVAEGVLDLARRDALRIDVGKRPGQDHAATQTRIHHLMLDHVRRGAHVVRLHGGDPSVFGRSGEELAFLRAHGVACAIIPGITAAVAAAAAIGVPLTDRRCAPAVLLATARRVRAWTDADWSNLARSGTTLALYMAVAQVETIACQLIGHGLPMDTPFILVERVSREDQRSITGELRELPAMTRQHGVRAPALLLIGETVRSAARPADAPRGFPEPQASGRAQGARKAALPLAATVPGATPRALTPPRAKLGAWIRSRSRT